MLKHEDNPQTPPQPAAKVRVSPEELAAAVTALQIRKEGQPGTIAIGDAVEEPGLDVTPEEVLAEVQARRQATPNRKRLVRGQRFILALGLAGVVLGAAIDGHGLLQKRGGQAALFQAPGSSSTLDQVPNEQQVYVDPHGLQQLIAGEKPDRVQVYSDYKNLRWGLIKHGGESYVQAYTVQSAAEVASDTFSLSNCTDHHGPNRIGMNYMGEFYPALKVTLPVKSLYGAEFNKQSEDDPTSLEENDLFLSGARSDGHLGDGFPDHFVDHFIK